MRAIWAKRIFLSADERAARRESISISRGYVSAILAIRLDYEQVNPLVFNVRVPVAIKQLGECSSLNDAGGYTVVIFPIL
jgi:hypothetical protein